MTQAADQSHLPSQVQLTTKRILLIDDEAPLRRVTQLTLKITAGWQVLTAASGSEGLHQAELEQPDAILLDLMMPEMDGLVTLKKLRENPTTQHIPVILLTAKVQAIPQLQFQQLGITAVLIKPFEPEHLVEQIKTALVWQ
ncbi:MAG: response regulator [Leptolyngbyaceae cyanobacterium CRU_2_3]|nr:response regulator [Leptolyngbyaceae cyanobacterium CRU_2_3]